jgi:hypothetical protein
VEKSWAHNLVARYSEAARHMRDAAMNEDNQETVQHYSEIAERYERLVEQTRALAEDERF